MLTRWNTISKGQFVIGVLNKHMSSSPRWWTGARIGISVPALFLAALWPTFAMDSQLHDSLEMPGAAGYALVQAFKILPGASSPNQAHTVLTNYTVEILARGGEYVVAFYPNIGSTPFVAYVRDGTVIAHDAAHPTLDAAPILVPGVIAGAVVAVYSEALSSNDPVVLRGAATFDVDVDVLAGGPLIAFVPNVLPAYFKTHNCVTGNCNGRSVYRVKFKSDGLEVTRRIIL